MKLWYFEECWLKLKKRIVWKYHFLNWTGKFRGPKIGLSYHDCVPCHCDPSCQMAAIVELGPRSQSRSNQIKNPSDCHSPHTHPFSNFSQILSIFFTLGKGTSVHSNLFISFNSVCCFNSLDFNTILGLELVV